jgi:hypothetical protein
MLVLVKKFNMETIGVFLVEIKLQESDEKM